MQTNDKIRQQLNSWHDLFLPFIESDAWDNIFRFLKHESGKGKVIIPDSINLFKSFELTNRHKLRAIIILMDPYPTMKGTVKIANGVPMDCSNTGVLQPSLELWHQAVESCYCGFDPDYDNRTDISFLLREEHVLLLNSSLSVEKDKVGSHSPAWQHFMQFFLEEIISKVYRGLPIILAGLSAQKLEKYIAPMLHYVKKVEHPIAASYANRTWDYQDIFKWTNNIITQNNGPGEQIRWYRKTGECTIHYPEWVTGERPNEDDIAPFDLPWSKTHKSKH